MQGRKLRIAPSSSAPSVEARLSSSDGRAERKKASFSGFAPIKMLPGRLSTLRCPMKTASPENRSARSGRPDQKRRIPTPGPEPARDKAKHGPGPPVQKEDPGETHSRLLPDPSPGLSPFSGLDESNFRRPDGDAVLSPVAIGEQPPEPVEQRSCFVVLHTASDSFAGRRISVRSGAFRTERLFCPDDLQRHGRGPERLYE